MDLFEIIIYLLIGLAAATAGSLMGVGGGFMMVPVFVFLGYNETYILAPVLSLFVIIFVALSASLKYKREGMINYQLGLLYAPFTIIGAFIGAEILQLIDAFIFKIIFSVIIGVTAVRIIYKTKINETESEESIEKNRKSYYWVILWGIITGLSASLAGIGGGLIAVPVIYIFFKETMHRAIATSLFIMIFTASFSTLWNYINLMGVLDASFFIAGLLVAVGAIIGGQVGSRIQTRLKGRTLQLLFGIFMIGIAIPLLWLGP